MSVETYRVVLSVICFIATLLYLTGWVDKKGSPYALIFLVLGTLLLK